MAKPNILENISKKLKPNSIDDLIICGVEHTLKNYDTLRRR